MSSLFERYRPASWEEVVGQSKAVGILRRLAGRGELSGRAYWLSGSSGTGKTTIARLLALDIADDFGIEELDATTLTVARLGELERSLAYKGMGSRTGRALIINEAHGLRKDVIRSLLVVLERLPAHAVVIFTTTCDGQESLFDDCDDSAPLLSRCLRLDLARRGLAEPFAARVQEIARAEGLDGRPIADYIRLAKDQRNNFRGMLGSVEAGAMLAPAD